MNATNLSGWVRDFPHIFHRDLKAEASAGYDAPVGPGWDGLLRDLFNALSEIERTSPGTVRIVQVKQKFGLLRVYLAKSNPAAHALIDASSHASGAVCEVCGGPSKVRNRGGWLTTECDGCHRP